MTIAIHMIIDNDDLNMFKLLSIDGTGSSVVTTNPMAVDRSGNIMLGQGGTTTINATGVSVNGTVTANKFVGDGSLLTGIATSGLSNQGLKDIAGLTSIDSTFIVGNGSNWVAETGSTARTSLGAQTQGDVLDDFNTLGAPASDGQFIVATGTGAFAYESAATVRSSLGLTVGTDVQAQGAVLDDFNTLGAPASDGEIIVATGTGAFAYESGATARTSLGLGLGDNVQFKDVSSDGKVRVKNSSSTSVVSVKNAGSYDARVAVEILDDDSAKDAEFYLGVNKNDTTKQVYRLRLDNSDDNMFKFLSFKDGDSAELNPLSIDALGNVMLGQGRGVTINSLGVSMNVPVTVNGDFTLYNSSGPTKFKLKSSGSGSSQPNYAAMKVEIENDNSMWDPEIVLSIGEAQHYVLHADNDDDNADDASADAAAAADDDAAADVAAAAADAAAVLPPPAQLAQL